MGQTRKSLDYLVGTPVSGLLLLSSKNIKTLHQARHLAAWAEFDAVQKADLLHHLRA